MRHYEIVFIFNPVLDEEAVNLKLERFHALLAGEGTGGELVEVEHWGIRQLAYPIEKQKSGYYLVSQVMADPTLLPEFERILTLDEELLRYLVVINAGEPANGMSVLAEVPESAAHRADDDDEDEDEDDDDDERGGASPPEFAGGRGRRRRMEGPPIEILNYKDVATLSRFITEQGKLLPRRTTKVTAPFQRQLGRAIKRARYLSLLPYVRSHE
jgi:small subunit ribosomal protein S6